MTSTPSPQTPSEPTIEDKELDRRYIAAFIHHDNELLNELYREGVSVEAVNARALRMGLTDEFIKRQRLLGTLPEMRKCIKCDARFLSAGRHNRLCKRCPPR